MKRRIYLDYAAATPLDAKVKKAMADFLAGGGANPSGLYKEGREASLALVNSRKIIAASLGVKSAQIFFTSSTTESNNLAILGAAKSLKKIGRHCITTQVEHVSVLNVFKKLEEEGFSVSYLKPDKYGRVSGEDVARALRPDTILVSVIFANNEIGTINNLKEIGGVIAKKKDKSGAPFLHTDAAQAFPHLKINPHTLCVDLMSFSSSKIYGPKGVGALYVGESIRLAPIMFGGDQENSLRPGTQDVAGIVGFAKAVEIMEEFRKKEEERLAVLRDLIIKNVSEFVPDILLNGHPSQRLTNNISFSVPGLNGEEIVAAMDEVGFALSTRSACDTGLDAPPHVIMALGRSGEEAWGTIRITLGRATTRKDAELFVKNFVGIIKKLKLIKSKSYA